MRKCPSCNEILLAPFVSCSFCDWQASKRGANGPRQPLGMTEEAKAAYEAAGKTSADLTEQQWYNVCRFFPTIARRCKRKFADVSQHNPLHATSKLGVMMGVMGGIVKPPRPYIDYEEAANEQELPL